MLEVVGPPDSWNSDAWRRLALTALAHNGAALQFAGPALAADPDAIETAVRSAGRAALPHIHESVQAEAEEKLGVHPAEWLAQQSPEARARHVGRIVAADMLVATSGGGGWSTGTACDLAAAGRPALRADAHAGALMVEM